jgi:glycosyltransferase involved in cell wall biosynthesis
VSSGALLIPLVSVIFKKPLAFDCHDTFQALRAKNTTILRKLLETSIEKLAYRFADLISVVSEQEKQYLLSLGIGKRRISVIPNGVDTKYFHKSKNKIEDKKKYGFESFQTVVFVGNMSYSPNAEAIQLLSSKIAPKVAEIVKDVKFLVVGKLQEQISLPGIEFTGFVDNLPGFLCCSDVAVAPLLHGSGTRLKILEYFSCGLPVVSTSIGAEGLAVKDGVNIFIENSIEGFSLRIISLLKNRDLSEHVGDSARTLVERSYDWEKISAKLEKSLIALLN